MCGIFGLIIKKGSQSSRFDIKNATSDLFKLSESRGKEASGIALLSDRTIKIYKESVPSSAFLKKRKFADIFKNQNYPLVILGHARLATNGALEKNINNQPVVKDGIVGIHNGIIVNDETLWQKFPQIQRKLEVDTEVFLSLVRLNLKQRKTLTAAIIRTFDLIEGAASVALLFDDRPYLALATNTGSLYFAREINNLVFASERYILEQFGAKNIVQIKPKNGIIVNINDLALSHFDFKQSKITQTNQKNQFKIIDLSTYKKDQPTLNQPLKVPNDILLSVKESIQKINSLKRCSRCLLPETMPFIEFDQEGVCNYCHNYKKMKVKGIDALKKVLVGGHKDKSNCLMTFSGGRDSSFGLHYFKKILKVNPIAYSYDWGMITDLGRRNQARMTGKLGIEHILVSADIKRKRENIRKNVEAWLRRPNLGTIPLFMAGDKQYFYYANKLGKRIGASSIILCINPLEKTDFKFGFCGVRPNVNVQYRLNWTNQMKLTLYYLKQYLLNPFYLNSSLFDTIFAFISFYFIPHNYVSFYQFKRWNEKEINQTLINDYNWEIAQDTKTTWRIGDGTASFYNYIYLIMAGFTENDTFKSNQIREGDISRQDALKLLEEDNKIRYESIKWYCDTIGIDFIKTLRTINKAPRKY